MKGPHRFGDVAALNNNPHWLFIGFIGGKTNEEGCKVVETTEIASLLEARLQEGETLKLEPILSHQLCSTIWRDTGHKEIVIMINHSFFQIPPSVAELKDYVLKRLGIEEPS